MSHVMDLSQTAMQRALKAAGALKERLSALTGMNAEWVLAASPEDAFRVWPAGNALNDLSGRGALALDGVIAPPALIRVGPEAAPLSVIMIEDENQAREIAALLAPPPLSLVEAGLDALRPAARQAARMDRADRDRTLSAMLPLLGEGAKITEDGLKLDHAGAKALGLAVTPEGLAFVPDCAAALALARHLGAGRGARAASVRRTTKETDIALSIDLDGEGGTISTGVHFFDHMLEQIARHGGLGLNAVCEGDVEVDAHHTIEDVSLALGEALREALGDKRGVARFGFETPMDETRASVWVDLSGRPFCKFEGVIPGERVGDFPVEMCAHAFRSLSESMKAAIHVAVEGENAHHMIESCFKSFGRALRMAKRIEGDELPSTKGVL